ncbi:MAG: helix-turn-helix transcriptional regulator [Caldilineaceae bacterium]
MIISKDLIAASATPLILSILSHGDSYGYAIIQRVHELSEGEMEWADGMLYPILHRLEKNELVESYWGKAENGRKRKYYRLRQSGLEELNEQRRSWHSLYAMLQKLEGGVVCPT